jgi:hypothetical protein
MTNQNVDQGGGNGYRGHGHGGYQGRGGYRGGQDKQVEDMVRATSIALIVGKRTT